MRASMGSPGMKDTKKSQRNGRLILNEINPIGLHETISAVRQSYIAGIGLPLAKIPTENIQTRLAAQAADTSHSR